jgi:hypothetical protein
VTTAVFHGNNCPCRNCASQHYLPALERLESLQQEVSRLVDELRTLRHRLALSEFRRLTMVIERCVESGDKDGCEAAVAERGRLGISRVEMSELLGKEAA